MQKLKAMIQKAQNAFKKYAPMWGRGFVFGAAFLIAPMGLLYLICGIVAGATALPLTITALATAAGVAGLKYTWGKPRSWIAAILSTAIVARVINDPGIMDAMSKQLELKNIQHLFKANATVFTAPKIEDGFTYKGVTYKAPALKSVA